VLAVAVLSVCAADEDLQHLFFGCPRLAPWYAAIGCPAATSAAGLEDGCRALASALRPLDPFIGHTLVLLVLWIIWKSRNRMIFDGHRMGPRQMFSLLVAHCGLWLHRLPQRYERHQIDVWVAARRV
jgi:hypothetical protein